MSALDYKTRKHDATAKVRLVEAALRQWDPIGVMSTDDDPLHDEYDGYAPHIVSMVLGGCTLAELVTHLGMLRTFTIGAHPDVETDRLAEDRIFRALGLSIQSLERSRDR